MSSSPDFRNGSGRNAEERRRHSSHSPDEIRRSRSRRTRSRSRTISPPTEEGCRIHIGDIGSDVTERDLEDAFGKFGKLKEVWVARYAPYFAFVVFGNRNDASEAIQMMNGSYVANSRIRCSIAQPRRRYRPPAPTYSSGYGGGYGGGGDRGYGGGERGGGSCRECGSRYHSAYNCPEVMRGGRGDDRYGGGYGGGGGGYYGGGRGGGGGFYDNRRRYSRSHSRTFSPDRRHADTRRRGSPSPGDSKRRGGGGVRQRDSRSVSGHSSN